jgi:AcrR family transcriptional regulator
VFNERGFRGTTLSHVAAAMGADRASLYYVGSKDELFEEMIREAVNVNLAAAKVIRKENAPAPEKLRLLDRDHPGRPGRRDSPRHQPCMASPIFRATGG